jgi:hypothetical protein
MERACKATTNTSLIYRGTDYWLRNFLTNIVNSVLVFIHESMFCIASILWPALRDRSNRYSIGIICKS